MEFLNKKGLILAADIEEKTSLLNVVEKVAPFIEAIKIGNIALYKNGWSIIREIKSIINLPVIADLKLMDIPEIAKRLTMSAINVGADGVIVCGPTGYDTIKTCRLCTCEQMLFIFSQFTHYTGLISDEMADEYIELAMDLKCDGIQLPGTRPNRIKKIREKIGKDPIILTCGIGAQGPIYGSAILLGANYEIIGRSIYNNKKPEKEAQKAQHQISKIVNKS